jgi:hypothetical protein
MVEQIDGKYYTPEISEFFVGFEYEELEFVYTDRGWYTKKEMNWVTKSYKCADYLEMYYLQEKVKRGIYRDVIRCKYLDSQDIVDLGFTDITPKRYAEELDYKEAKLFKLDEYTFLFYNLKTHKMVIDNGESYGDRNTYFQGYIKNKSELQKLLKQLNTE